MSSETPAVGAKTTDHRVETGALLLIAVLVSSVLWRLLSTAPDLRVTATMAPWVLAALQLLRSPRISETSGQGNRLFDYTVLAVPIALFFITVPRWGLPRGEQVAMAVYVLFVLWQAALVLPRLRGDFAPLVVPKSGVPNGAPTATWRPVWRCLCTALAVYLAFLPWSTEERPPDGDEPWYLLIAHSLAHDFDTDLSDNYQDRDSLSFMQRAIEPQPGDPVGQEGQRWSRHNALLPAFLALPLRIAGKEGALATMALLSSLLTALVVLLLARWRVGGPRSWAAVWFVVAFLSPLLQYSYQAWVEVPAAVCVALGLLAAHEISDRDANRRRWVVLLAFTLVALPLFKIRFVLLAVGLLAYAAFQVRLRRRAWILLVATASVLLGGMLVYNQIQYGRALRIHEWSELRLLEQPLRNYLFRGLGLFFDESFGLFTTAPIWMLIMPGALLVWRHRGPRLAVCLIALPYLLLVASRREWYGGWSPPFRYPMALLPLFGPLLALPLADLLGESSDQKRPWRPGALLVPLLFVSLLLAILWVVLPGLTYNFADGRSLWGDALTVRLPADLHRWLPSATRFRRASWAVPLAVAFLFMLVWKIRPRVAGRTSGTWATTLALCGLAATPYLLARAPTQRIEPESPAITKTGGQSDPERWQVDRTRYPEGWVLREGDEMRARVQPAGPLARIAVRGRLIRNWDHDVVLQLACGHERLALLVFKDHEVWWTAANTVEWPSSGCPLIIRASGPSPLAPPGIFNGVALDFVQFQWLAERPPVTADELEAP